MERRLSGDHIQSFSCLLPPDSSRNVALILLDCRMSCIGTHVGIVGRVLLLTVTTRKPSGGTWRRILICQSSWRYSAEGDIHKDMHSQRVTRMCIFLAFLPNTQGTILFRRPSLCQHEQILTCNTQNPSGTPYRR